MTKQKLALTLTTLTLVSTVFVTTPLAYAEGPSGTSGNNFFQGLISFISQKFNLDKTQVENAINDYKNQHKKTHIALTPDQIRAKEKQRLDKLVSDKKITSAQETAILNELSTLQNKYKISSLPGQEKINQKKAMEAELQTWAKDNNINFAYVGGFGMGRLENGPRRGLGPKRWTTPTPTP